MEAASSGFYAEGAADHLDQPPVDASVHAAVEGYPGQIPEAVNPALAGEAPTPIETGVEGSGVPTDQPVEPSAPVARPKRHASAEQEAAEAARLMRYGI